MCVATAGKKEVPEDLAFVETCVDAARRFVRGRFLTGCDAEDVAHEALRRLLVADLACYAPSCPMAAIVNSFVLHEFTKALRRPRMSDLAELGEHETAISSDTEELDLLVDLSEALKRCTRRQAGVVLRLIDGLTAVAVAREIGCTAANIGKMRRRFLQNHFPEFSRPEV